MSFFSYYKLISTSFFLLFLNSNPLFVTSKSAAEWASSRRIYQVITDRFARPDNNNDAGCDLSKRRYCGGGFKGIENNLDHIQHKLGMNAIWISPIVQNTELYLSDSDGEVQQGYHGYWAKDLFNVNPYFGSFEDLKQLSKALHSRGMWLMIDVVANHMGPEIKHDLSNLKNIVTNPQNYPLDQEWAYHSYCPIEDWNNVWQVQNCWLADLPDIDQSNDAVKNLLLKWIKWLIEEFDVDGIRIDTCLEVPMEFWREFSRASGVYTVCEADNDDIGINAEFQKRGVVDGTLNYPLFWMMKKLFLGESTMNSFDNLGSSGSSDSVTVPMQLQSSSRNSVSHGTVQTRVPELKLNENTNTVINSNKVTSNSNSMSATIRQFYRDAASQFTNLDYLGNFVDNHDNARFRSNSKDLNKFKSAITWSFLWPGIPILYQGDEFAFFGGNDPYNREIVWPFLKDSGNDPQNREIAWPFLKDSGNDPLNREIAWPFLKDSNQQLESDFNKYDHESDNDSDSDYFDLRAFILNLSNAHEIMVKNQKQESSAIVIEEKIQNMNQSDQEQSTIIIDSGNSNTNTINIIERYAADEFYCFSRGPELMACFTNTKPGKSTIHYKVTYLPDGFIPESQGSDTTVSLTVCNIFYGLNDCVDVKKTGPGDSYSLDVWLEDGEPKVFVRKDLIIPATVTVSSGSTSATSGTGWPQFI